MRVPPHAVEGEQAEQGLPGLTIKPQLRGAAPHSEACSDARPRRQLQAFVRPPCVAYWGRERIAQTVSGIGEVAITALSVPDSTVASAKRAGCFIGSSASKIPCSGKCARSTSHFATVWSSS